MQTKKPKTTLATVQQRQERKHIAIIEGRFKLSVPVVDDDDAEQVLRKVKFFNHIESAASLR